MLKLLDVIRSPKVGKKWRAIFSDGTKTDFGAAGYQDYTQHHDKERRRLYMSRHFKDLKTEDPRRAGYLSMYLLWGPSTSFQENLRQYKNMFNV